MRDVTPILCERLKAMPELSALSGILTHVPKDMSYPYISLEKLSSQENFGTEVTQVKLKAWSRYAGNAEVSNFESILKNTLEKQGFIEGVCLKIEGAKISVLNDGITRVLEMDLSVLVREA